MALIKLKPHFFTRVLPALVVGAIIITAAVLLYKHFTKKSAADEQDQDTDGSATPPAGAGVSADDDDDGGEAAAETADAAASAAAAAASPTCCDEVRALKDRIDRNETAWATNCCAQHASLKKRFDAHVRGPLHTMEAVLLYALGTRPDNLHRIRVAAETSGILAAVREKARREGESLDKMTDALVEMLRNDQLGLREMIRSFKPSEGFPVPTTQVDILLSGHMLKQMIREELKMDNEHRHDQKKNETETLDTESDTPNKSAHTKPTESLTPFTVTNYYPDPRPMSTVEMKESFSRYPRY